MDNLFKYPDRKCKVCSEDMNPQGGCKCNGYTYPKSLEFEAFKMAREQARNSDRIYTAPELRKVEERIKAMKKCENCGKSFFPEDGGITTSNWEYDYCSRKCWENSVRYQLDKQIFLAFYNTLNEAQKMYFKHEFINNLFCQDYELEIVDWLDKEGR